MTQKKKCKVPSQASAAESLEADSDQKKVGVVQLP